MTWRPLPGPAREEEPRAVRESLHGLARRIGAPPPEALAALFGGWEDAVGPSIAGHARPVSLVGGVLVVVVDEPGWATQLRYLSAGLIERFGELVGPDVVQRVEVRVAR